MKSSHRLSFLAPLIVRACALAGGIYAPGLAGVSAASNEDDIRASLRTFSSVYTQIEQNAADPLDPDKAVYNGAIPGMLRTLDPHSSFFDPRYFALMREEQRGHYYGVGMRVGARSNRTMVMEIFAGSPAQKGGLRPGDLLLTVNGKSTEGLTTADVADLLKGPRGTTAKVTASRPGHDEPMAFDVVRDEINRKSVPDPMFVRPGIGYVQIQQFTETTSHDLDEALKALGEQNIKGLVLDLRGNPGGLLNEGVAVADRFLQKGQVIVSHRGRASAEKRYAARGGSSRDFPIVVLVNRLSASAAEIVAGALQDHDRAWVLGDNTFGKGLVQTVYPLAENTGLALTTAKYYTPSERLIQRDYSSMSFFDYYNNRKTTDTPNTQDVKMTDSGRTVYGGGGIAPDEKFSPPKANRFQIELIRQAAVFNFTAKYFGTHDPKLAKGWTPDQGFEDGFHQFLLDSGATFTEAEYAENHAWVHAQLKQSAYAYAFSVDERDRVAVEADPEVARAADSMPKAKALLDNAKKLLAQRSQK